MKKIIIFCIAVLTVSFISCSKSKASQDSTTVKYDIYPMNIYITKISYVDNNGKLVVNANPMLKDSVVSFSISTKPFNAKISVESNNTSVNSFNYVIGIFVNGKLVNINQVTIHPNADETNSLEYTVQ